MSWTRVIASTALTCLAGGVITAPALADVMVVRSSGPSAANYKPGVRLADDAPVALKAGDQLVLLDKGGTRTVRGPGRFTATASSSPAATNVALAALTGSNTRRARVGAVRAAGPAASPTPPNIWFVDTAKGGPACIADGTRPTLWRADSAGAATTRVDGGGKSVDVRWAPGQASQPWPVTLPAKADASYALEPGGAQVRFTTLGRAPGDLVALGDALLARGCEAQMDMLIATTRK